MTQVILLEPVDNLGEAGAQVRVRSGYARNFLIPRGLALPATSANQAELNARLEQRARVLAERKGDAERLKAMIEAYKAEKTPAEAPQAEEAPAAPAVSETSQAEASAEDAASDTAEASSEAADTATLQPRKEASKKVEKEAPAHAIVIPVRAGESRIYGSVGNQDIADAIEKQFDIQIDRRKLQLRAPIKDLGHYTIVYKPHPEVPIDIDISVVSDEEI